MPILENVLPAKKPGIERHVRVDARLSVALHRGGEQVDAGPRREDRGVLERCVQCRLANSTPAMHRNITLEKKELLERTEFSGRDRFDNFTRAD